MLSCRFFAKRFTRHNSLEDDVHLWLCRRGIQAEKEVIVGDGQQRMDIWVRSQGKVYWADVTVTEPGCPSLVARASHEAGVAVAEKEQQKLSKWAGLAREHHVPVTAIAFETSGRRGKMADTFLRHMARVSRSSSTAPSLDSLWLQLSVTMAKNNVLLLREAVRAATGVGSARSRVGYGRPLAA